MPIQGLDIILVGIMIFSGLPCHAAGADARDALHHVLGARRARDAVCLFPISGRLVRELDRYRRCSPTHRSSASVFISSLIIFSLLTANVSERVLDSRVGAIDRTLGFVYGLVRGLILVVIAYLIVGQIVDRQNCPNGSRKRARFI